MGDGDERAQHEITVALLDLHKPCRASEARDSSRDD
jgi:hypothetical protein